ncbi:uncharacterized protein C19orf44-like [Montipora foliosa]|uniref:uncharacterized protein C19orf44-like n=1 Tax=Montipora foliosa TaxID=591990 RepID=UPI0035F1150B
MASTKHQWKGSVEKARRQSRELPTNLSPKGSVIGEETSAKELAEYLETLKKKSGIKSLWRGESFDRAVRDDEDKTPDISISSIDEDEFAEKPTSEGLDVMDDDDFKVNVQMFSRTPTPTNDNSTESSVNPLKGLQMAEFALPEEELSDKLLANNNVDNQLKSLSIYDKDIKSVVNNLSESAEILTEDEVGEEIEEDVVVGDETVDNTKTSRPRTTSRNKSISEKKRSLSLRTISDAGDKTSLGKYEKTHTRSEHSYTSDFSSGSEVQTQSEQSYSHTYSKEKSSRSSKTSRSLKSGRTSRSSRSSNTSRSSRSSRSHERSQSKGTKSDYSKSKNTDNGNKYRCDVGVQTVPMVDQFTLPSGLAVGMATSSTPHGMQYVDPSPIATHTVAPEAMEAMTAYNPAIVALNNMLREQIRLVEQFVEINQRMYESYSTSINSNYRYTTLEDTRQFIKENRPKPISYEEALKQVKREER